MPSASMQTNDNSAAHAFLFFATSFTCHELAHEQLGMHLLLSNGVEQLE